MNCRRNDADNFCVPLVNHVNVFHMSLGESLLNDSFQKNHVSLLVLSNDEIPLNDRLILAKNWCPQLPIMLVDEATTDSSHSRPD